MALSASEDAAIHGVMKCGSLGLFDLCRVDRVHAGLRDIIRALLRRAAEAQEYRRSSLATVHWKKGVDNLLRHSL
jgi:hypothetical protein